MNVRISLCLIALTAAVGLSAPATTLAQGANEASVDTETSHLMTAANIRNAVEEELLLDPGVQSTWIDVRVVGGVVTLTGTVDNMLARDRAALVAETVKGVESVVDRIAVEPAVDRTGEELRADVQAALITNPATDAYEISVVADEAGAVTLRGEVESWTERRLAERVAKGVAGVTALENALVIRVTADRSDVEIQREVEEALRWSRLIDEGLIDVSVDDGAVALTGTVGSAAEKRQAEIRAWTAGVSTVDASGLEVARWARDADLRPTPNVWRPDADVKEAIEQALLFDPRINSLNVETTVQDGAVTLRGTVDSVGARRAAVQDARNTTGVTVVRDRLQVRTDGRRPDAELTQAVDAALDRAPALQRREVSVSVVNGIAYLYGTVDNYYEKGLADDVAANVDGVTAVENALAVQSTDWVGFNPFLDGPYLYGFDWYDYTPAHTWMPDEHIANEIENQLWWSPFVDSSDVTVEVEDGVATLSGSVESLAEFEAARENAYEGGAILVDNNLTIE